jgi:extradiol dioxygenase family protein
MFVPKIDHLVLSVKDIKESKKFYKALFVDFLDYQISLESEDFLAIDFSGQFLLEICQEHPEFKNSSFDRYRVGLHHFGLTIENYKQINELYIKLLELGAVILDPPRFYPEYSENYYALFYEDPNGFKMEFVSYG